MFESNVGKSALYSIWCASKDVRRVQTIWCALVLWWAGAWCIWSDLVLEPNHSRMKHEVCGQVECATWQNWTAESGVRTTMQVASMIGTVQMLRCALQRRDACLNFLLPRESPPLVPSSLCFSGRCSMEPRPDPAVLLGHVSQSLSTALPLVWMSESTSANFSLCSSTALLGSCSFPTLLFVMLFLFLLFSLELFTTFFFFSAITRLC